MLTFSKFCRLKEELMPFPGRSDLGGSVQVYHRTGTAYPGPADQYVDSVVKGQKPLGRGDYGPGYYFATDISQISDSNIRISQFGFFVLRGNISLMNIANVSRMSSDELQKTAVNPETPSWDKDFYKRNMYKYSTGTDFVSDTDEYDQDIHAEAEAAFKEPPGSGRIKKINALVQKVRERHPSTRFKGIMYEGMGGLNILAFDWKAFVPFYVAYSPKPVTNPSQVFWKGVNDWNTKFYPNERVLFNGMRAKFIQDQGNQATIEIMQQKRTVNKSEISFLWKELDERAGHAEPDLLGNPMGDSY